MTGTTTINTPEATRPQFGEEAKMIALGMADMPVEELARILKINPKLATESYLRFQAFHSPEPSPIPALAAYTGVVFKHIHPEDFSMEDFRFAQEHLRIVSICYGLLRPLDAIKPYRMEYEVGFPETGTENMYAFWRPKQTQVLINNVRQDDGILFNLASQEDNLLSIGRP